MVSATAPRWPSRSETGGRRAPAPSNPSRARPSKQIPALRNRLAPHPIATLTPALSAVCPRLKPTGVRKQLVGSPTNHSSPRPRHNNVCKTHLTWLPCQATFPLSSELDRRRIGAGHANETQPDLRGGDVGELRDSRGRHDRAGDPGAQLGAGLVGRVAARGVGRDASPAGGRAGVLASLAPPLSPLALRPIDAQFRAGASNRAGPLAGATGFGDGRFTSDDQLDRAGSLHAVAAARVSAGAILRDDGGGDVR